MSNTLADCPRCELIPLTECRLCGGTAHGHKVRPWVAVAYALMHEWEIPPEQWELFERERVTPVNKEEG